MDWTVQNCIYVVFRVCTATQCLQFHFRWAIKENGDLTCETGKTESVPAGEALHSGTYTGCWAA